VTRINGPGKWPDLKRSTEKDDMFDRTVETIGCLKEMREACAACLRVLYIEGLVDEIENEWKKIGIKRGFGKRCQELIAKLEAK
jgi:hypothetical protein